MSNLFRLENYWLQHIEFQDTVNKIWEQNVNEVDSAKILIAKFKRLRKGLKVWSKGFQILLLQLKLPMPLLPFGTPLRNLDV